MERQIMCKQETQFNLVACVIVAAVAVADMAVILVMALNG